MMAEGFGGVAGWLGMFSVCLPLLFSCSLEDERDACCWENTVFFRYEYEGRDCFQEYIRETRWFLFGGDGGFLAEMDRMPCCPQRVDISGLAEGDYRLVCVGNLSGCGELEGYAEEGAEAFRLRLEAEDGGLFPNGDRLYWGECRFSVRTGFSNRFRGEMSNVHCVLNVRVEWELTPEYPDGYFFRLDGIGTEMSLSGSHADSIGVHRFPPVWPFSGVMSEAVPLRRFSLESSLVTLRWAGGHYPVLRLWHRSGSVMKPVVLEDIFRRWDWRPECSPVQEYSLRLLIRPDGSVEVGQGLEAGVGDWEDGGMLG